MAEKKIKIIRGKNRKARHDLRSMKTYEAGIELTGTEVKSLRARQSQYERQLRPDHQNGRGLCL